MSDLTAELDRLYAAPLSEFVALRDEIVKELKAAGRKDDAATVKALRKPSAAAWTVNQLSFTAAEELEALAEATKSLVEAHGNPEADVAGAIQLRRKRLDRLLESARELWAAHGLNSTKDQLRRLSGTLEAATQPGADPRPGRLSTDLEPAGFGALAGLQIATPNASRSDAARQTTAGSPSKRSAKKTDSGRTGPTSPKGSPKKSPRTDHPPTPPSGGPTSKTNQVEDADSSARARAAAEGALMTARTKLERLERLVARAEADAAAARRRVGRDRAKLVELEERVEQARKALDDSTSRAGEKEDAFAELQKDREAAQARVDEAAAALDELAGA